MQLRKIRPGPPSPDTLISLAPIFRQPFRGEPELIGSGFWLTPWGHLVTAWHVIDDNIGEGGIDEGYIFAVQTTAERRAIPRPLRRTWRHSTYDLALSEALAPDGYEDLATPPVMLTLDEPKIGDGLATHAMLPVGQDFVGEKLEGVTTADFHGEMTIPEMGVTYSLSFSARAGFGHLTDIFPEKRDAVMMPFPCFQSDIPVYGANSGGPVYDVKGRVCAINCTSYSGADISFHMPTKGVLELFAEGVELIPEDPVARRRSVLELGLARRALFDPPLERVFFTLPQRILLWPYHRCLDAIAWARWRASGGRPS